MGGEIKVKKCLACETILYDGAPGRPKIEVYKNGCYIECSNPKCKKKNEIIKSGNSDFEIVGIIES